MNKDLLTLPFTEEGYFSKADLQTWLEALERYVDGKEVGEGKSAVGAGDTMRLLLSIQQCGPDIVANDDEAELVRRGIRLGLQLAALDRKQYHSNVSKRTLKPRKKTVTDEQILAAIDAFPTRAKQSGISARQINRRLEKIPKP
jgi:hypothetical protein